MKKNLFLMRWTKMMNCTKKVNLLLESHPSCCPQKLKNHRHWHTLPPNILSTTNSGWKKIFLIHSWEGGVGPPTSEMGIYFLIPLAPSVPIFNKKIYWKNVSNFITHNFAQIVSGLIPNFSKVGVSIPCCCHTDASLRFYLYRGGCETNFWRQCRVKNRIRAHI